jgi:hypothetical protein
MRDEHGFETSRARDADELAGPAARPSELFALHRRLGNGRLMQLRRALQRRSGTAAPEWMKAQLGITPESEARAAQDAAEERAAEELRVPAGGQALPVPLQRQAEEQLATSLSGVKLAHGADAACDSIGALAFTTPSEDGGHTVALSSAVNLDSDEGRFTLMHELAHVAQQRRGATAGLSGLGGDDGARADLENQADAAAAQALRGQSGGS